MRITLVLVFIFITNSLFSQDGIGFSIGAHYTTLNWNSMNTFVDSYNSVNQSTLVKELKAPENGIGFNFGVRRYNWPIYYEFDFSHFKSNKIAEFSDGGTRTFVFRENLVAFGLAFNIGHEEGISFGPALGLGLGGQKLKVSHVPGSSLPYSTNLDGDYKTLISAQLRLGGVLHIPLKTGIKLFSRLDFLLPIGVGNLEDVNEPFLYTSSIGTDYLYWNSQPESYSLADKDYIQSDIKGTRLIIGIVIEIGLDPDGF